MSTIWTPSGEYVPREEPKPETGAAGPEREPTPEEYEAAVAAARKEILERPVLDHLAGHVMGLFELAALHLDQEAATGGKEKVDLAEVSLALDAAAALVEGLGTRLGRYESYLADALAQLRLAFVQASST